jgi:hypothetical protein
MICSSRQGTGGVNRSTEKRSNFCSPPLTYPLLGGKLFCQGKPGQAFVKLKAESLKI